MHVIFTFVDVCGEQPNINEFIFENTQKEYYRINNRNKFYNELNLCAYLTRLQYLVKIF